MAERSLEEQLEEEMTIATEGGEVKMSETTRVYARIWAPTGGGSKRAYTIQIAECGSKECLTSEFVIKDIEKGVAALKSLGLKIKDILVEVFEMNLNSSRRFVSIRKLQGFCTCDLKSSLSLALAIEK